MVAVRPAPAQRQGRLVPTLGLFSTTALIVGSMIGSGIFLLPAEMFDLVRNPLALLLVWVVGGLFTIFGALTFAELAGLFPRAGGQYVFLRESMGRGWAFLYGWTMFWVIQTGIIAAVAIAFARFGQRLTGFAEPWIAPVAVACIAFLSLVNYFGVAFGGLVQNVFTVAKFAALLALVVFGFLLGSPEHATFDQAVAEAPVGGALFVAFVLAMLQGFFALDGWPQAAYVAPEVKRPTRNVPRAMILGVGLVTTVYVLATSAYLFLVNAQEILGIAASQGRLLIAAEAARAFGGDGMLRLVSASVVVSTFGTVNAYILTSPRVFYAVAQDGLFWHPFRRLHPIRNTPHVGILFAGLWASFLVVLGRLSNNAYLAIVTAVVFGIWLFYIPTVVGYFRLRRTRPDADRPYRTPLYPIVPALFLLAATTVVVTLLVDNVYRLATQDLSGRDIAGLSGIWGSLLVLTGTPLLAWWAIRARRGDSSPLSATAPP